MDLYSNNYGLYRRLILRFIILVLGLAFVFLALPRLIRLFLPFLIAFGVVMLINPLVHRINKRFGISRRMIALVVDVVVFGLIASILGIIVYTLIIEAVALATYLQANMDRIIQSLDGLENNLSWIYSFLPQWFVDTLTIFEDRLIIFLQDSSGSILSFILNLTRSLTLTIGNFLIALLIAILAAYFMLVEYSRVSTMSRRRMGRRFSRTLILLKKSVIQSLGGFFRSQLLIAGIAFVVMYLALVLYGQAYALLIAFILAIVDLLPLIGTIAVLLPWGLLAMLNGDIQKGIFLIGLGIGFFLLRRILEPKIVGSQTGLHPLVALVSIYVGLQISGVWGAILGPLVVMLVLSVYKTGIWDDALADIRDFMRIVSHSLKRPDTARNRDLED